MVKKIPSTVLLYKLLMQKAIIDTRATTYNIRTSLNNLSTCMGTVNSNTELFNHHVKNTIEGLRSRGEDVSNLCIKLFQGYKSVRILTLLTISKKKEEDYLDGADVVSESLMKLALNKYILRKENGEWGSTSSEQEELTALTIEMSRYKTDAENGKRPGKNRSK